MQIVEMTSIAQVVVSLLQTGLIAWGISLMKLSNEERKANTAVLYGIAEDLKANAATLNASVATLNANAAALNAQTATLNAHTDALRKLLDEKG